MSVTLEQASRGELETIIQDLDDSRVELDYLALPADISDESARLIPGRVAELLLGEETNFTFYAAERLEKVAREIGHMISETTVDEELAVLGEMGYTLLDLSKAVIGDYYSASSGLRLGLHEGKFAVGVKVSRDRLLEIVDDVGPEPEIAGVNVREVIDKIVFSLDDEWFMNELSYLMHHAYACLAFDPETKRACERVIRKLFATKDGEQLETIILFKLASAEVLLWDWNENELAEKIESSSVHAMTKALIYEKVTSGLARSGAFGLVTAEEVRAKYGDEVDKFVASLQHDDEGHFDGDALFSSAQNIKDAMHDSGSEWLYTNNNLYLAMAKYILGKLDDGKAGELRLAEGMLGAMELHFKPTLISLYYRGVGAEYSLVGLREKLEAQLDNSFVQTGVVNLNLSELPAGDPWWQLPWWLDARDATDLNHGDECQVFEERNGYYRVSERGWVPVGFVDLEDRPVETAEELGWVVVTQEGDGQLGWNFDENEVTEALKAGAAYRVLGKQADMVQIGEGLWFWEEWLEENLGE